MKIFLESDQFSCKNAENQNQIRAERYIQILRNRIKWFCDETKLSSCENAFRSVNWRHLSHIKFKTLAGESRNEVLATPDRCANTRGRSAIFEKERRKGDIEIHQGETLSACFYSSLSPCSLRQGDGVTLCKSIRRIASATISEFTQKLACLNYLIRSRCDCHDSN